MAKDILDIGGYTIIRRLGTGARSTIYLAQDEEDGKTVALKRITYEKPEDSRIFEQVHTEFKVAQKVNHPYIRKCYDLKKIGGLFKQKELLLSMEYFDGYSLEDCPTLSLGDVLLVFRMVASGLSAMHQHGFIHCDIKPNNILINKSGSIKIIDLGQSCKSGTIKQRIQGTPDYIAPEQVKRQHLSPKTDIFNLGATMYWALTGKHAPTLIPKSSSLGLAMIEPKKAPHEIKPLLPISISKLVMDCIEDEPVNRPLDMMQVISRIDVMVHSIFGGKIKSNKNGTNNNRTAEKGNSGQ